MTVTSESTLKELVDETGLIKNELVSCRDNLKNNLSDKGVDVATTNKMQGLIEKVNEVEINPFFVNKNLFKTPFIHVNINEFLEQKLSRATCYTKNGTLYYLGGYTKTNELNRYRYGLNLYTNEKLEKESSVTSDRVLFNIYNKLDDADNFAYYAEDVSSGNFLIIYDINTKTFTVKVMFSEMASYEKVGNFMYSFGGKYSNGVYKYDLQTFTRELVGNIPTTTDNAISFLDGNYVYLLPNRTSYKGVRYDLITNTSTEIIMSANASVFKKYYNFSYCKYKNHVYILNGSYVFVFDMESMNYQNYMLPVDFAKSWVFGFTHDYTLFSCGGYQDEYNNSDVAKMIAIKK